MILKQLNNVSKKPAQAGLPFSRVTMTKEYHRVLRGSQRGTEENRKGIRVMLNPDQEGEINQITNKIIGAAIEVHRNLGSGLFETVYEQCLCYELKMQKINFERQKYMPVVYKGKTFENGFRADLLVESQVIVELKAANSLLPVHETQILNYLRLAKLNIGLIINFNVPILKEGIKRVISGRRNRT